MKEMISIVFSHGIKSLEIIQAYLLLSFWPLEAEERCVFLLPTLSPALMSLSGSSIRGHGCPRVSRSGKHATAHLVLSLTNVPVVWRQISIFSGGKRCWEMTPKTQSLPGKVCIALESRTQLQAHAASHEEIKNRERCWLWCFALDRSWSVQVSRFVQKDIT